MSYNNWYAKSDEKLAMHIGNFVKQHRIRQHKSQDVLATEAGISRSTLSLLEKGSPVTLATLLQVLRVLQKLEVLHSFDVEYEISPMAMYVAEHSSPKYGSSKRKYKK